MPVCSLERVEYMAGMAETKKRDSAQQAVRYVRDLGKRRIIFTFAGKESMTELLICYAGRKTSLKF